MGEDILTFCYKGLPGHLACRAAAVSEYMSFASAVNEFAGVTNDDSRDATKIAAKPFAFVRVNEQLRKWTAELMTAKG